MPQGGVSQVRNGIIFTAFDAPKHASAIEAAYQQVVAGIDAERLKLAAEFQLVFRTLRCTVLPELDVILEKISSVMQAEQAATWTEKTRRDAGSNERG